MAILECIELESSVFKISLLIFEVCMSGFGFYV